MVYSALIQCSEKRSLLIGCVNIFAPHSSITILFTPLVILFLAYFRSAINLIMINAVVSIKAYRDFSLFLNSVQV